MDVYIYKLDLNVENPVVEKYPAQTREGTYGDEVIYWVGPNDYRVWHSEFDIRMVGTVYEPIDNVIELIIKRDERESESITMIEDYCFKKAESIRKKLKMFYKGARATMRFRIAKVIKQSGPLYGTRATQVFIDDFDPPEIPPVSRPIDITDDQFDGDPVLIIPGPFEGEEDV